MNPQKGAANPPASERGRASPQKRRGQEAEDNGGQHGGGKTKNRRTKKEGKEGGKKEKEERQGRRKRGGKEEKAEGEVVVNHERALVSGLRHLSDYMLWVGTSQAFFFPHTNRRSGLVCCVLSRWRSVQPWRAVRPSRGSCGRPWRAHRLCTVLGACHRAGVRICEEVAGRRRGYCGCCHCPPGQLRSRQQRGSCC